MIRVTIELCPLGNERPEAVKEIGRMYIANDGTGTIDRGDYKVAVCRRGSTEVPRELFPEGTFTGYEEGRPPKATRTGSVRNYPRLAYNVWRLIARSLLSAFPEENRGGKARAAADDAPTQDDESGLT